MCGRARCTLNPQQVARTCSLSPADAASIPTLHLDRYRPSYNVAPGAYLPVFVVRREGGGSEGGGGPLIHCMKWGLVPSFTKKTEKPDHFRMFNARSESIKDKASFRRLLPNNRCLVAVEGFYEWKKEGTKKQPYYIHFKNQQPLVFAALYDSWKNSEGEVLYTFTILTTRSSSALQWLHDRMPVILGDSNSIDTWLNVSTPNFLTILGPCEDPNLVWYPATPAMGKLSFDGPECIKEIQLKSADEKPLSKFFSKKTKSEPKVLKSSEELTHEESLNSLKEEPSAEDAEEVTKEEKGVIEPELCGRKRVFEESYSNSGVTGECVDTHPTSGVKKEKSLKRSGDKQASMLSYFSRK